MYSPSPGPTTPTAGIIIEKLIDWKVEVVFGLVAEQDNPLARALNRKKNTIRYVAVHNEKSAALMAGCYAKCSGNLGVCIATMPPAATQLLNGLADASGESAPILAITGVIDRNPPGTPFIVFEQDITGPIHALTVVDLACRSALNIPGIAHITVALDTQTNVSIWPQYLAAAISHQVKDEAILAADPKARSIFATHHWHTRTGRPLVIANAAATPGLPYALAAQLTWPNRQCIALVCDDNAVTLMDDLSTAVYYHLPVKIIVIKNNNFSIDFTRLAAACGMDAHSCKQPGDLQSVIRQSLASPAPALIEVELETSDSISLRPMA